ncbi:MAG: GNAT family N-acetyltransferase [Candidatus Thermoplasmatota archaeon]|nr:GNAT family N-acetyltransferase [Candidatus Thermoplasmatota archaeon]
MFGKNGACEGCWCMWWRIPYSQFIRQKNEMNRKAIKEIVDSGKVPGILAYFDGAPVGWCAIAPREEYLRLERSRILKRVDEKPVWSVTCFFVAKEFRCKGLTSELLKAAVKYAGGRGAKIVEGYPTDLKKEELPDAFVYTGLASAFVKAGFREVARRSEKRPIMRRFL